jgi:hypothetical protein
MNSRLFCLLEKTFARILLVPWHVRQQQRNSTVKELQSFYAQ